MPTELNVLALIKGTERYVFVYDDAGQAELLAAFRDQAADPRLSLSWFDATVLAQKAREQARGQQGDAPKGDAPKGDTPPAHRIREVS